MAVEVVAAREHVGAWRGPMLVVGGLTIVAVCGLALGLRRSSSVQAFSVVFLSIVLEALPFIVIGSVVSAALETVAPERVSRVLRRVPSPVAVPVGAMLGCFLPVCECASIPVARRLARRGFPPNAALAYMLAAPVVNPVVIVATAIAFRGRPSVVWGRVVIAYFVAVVVAWVLSPQAAGMFAPSAGTQEVAAVHAHEQPESRLSFSDVLADDIVFMGRYLVVGATLAAALQALVPRSVLDGVARTTLGSVITLMVLAVALSVCSEADAFVAASFTSFVPGALVAFLVFGPMVDLKLIAIYGGSFGAAATRRLVLAIAGPVVVGALWFQVMVR